MDNKWRKQGNRDIKKKKLYKKSVHFGVSTFKWSHGKLTNEVGRLESFKQLWKKALLDKLKSVIRQL